MDRDLFLRTVEWLDALVWECPADPLKLLEPGLTVWLDGNPFRWKEILGELSDESLAWAVKKRFLLAWAFEELLVSRYDEYLQRWFLRWGATPDDTQDLKQKLYLKFFARCLDTYEPVFSFRNYLWATARNDWAAAQRARRRKISLDDVPEPSTNGAEPKLGVLGTELREQLEAVVGALPAEQQQVLRDTMDGKSAEEIARSIGRTKRAVYMLLFRARRTVAQALGLPSQKGASARASP